MKRLPLILLLFALLAQHMRGDAQPQNDRETIQIGSIDYFGYAGLDLKKIEVRLPIKVGDRITRDVFDRDRKIIPDLVKEIAGKPTTDIAAVCCDQNGRLMIYIGLSGASSQPIVFNLSPQGKDQLGTEALDLYARYGAAQQSAVKRGVTSENDSEGYALSSDAASHKIELAIREYALSHGDLIQRVLRNSADVEQRRVSACFLGYADRSAEQIRNLASATKDQDAEVRNNATRALWVLASAKNSSGIKVSPTPFIDLLFSSQWTDRNKSSLVLMQLTQELDPELLGTLRNRAMAPLLEGLRWTNPGHSSPFLFILGRIEGISEDRLKQLAATGDKTQVIQAAEQLASLRQ